VPVDAVTFRVVDPTSLKARWAMTQYFDELDRVFDGGFERGDAIDEGALVYRDPTGSFLLAEAGGDVVGCGAVVHLDDRRSEIKRMWVSPTARGKRLGKRLLARLEEVVRHAGRRTVVLDTNAVLVEAISLYEAAGYRPVEPYNDNPYATHWFVKDLP
jgi:GNAT superfamily N-acetyltransferase